MKIKKSLVVNCLMLLTAISITGMKFPDVIDYLSVGKQLNFNGAKYDLVWSSHPAENYYKQEYLKQGEGAVSYHNMILIEAVKGNVGLKDALNAKVTELNLRKSWDFVANFQVYENKKKPEEGILDFVVSDTMTTYEWNLYRYQVQKGALILFAYCYRDSLNDNEDLKKFFGHIKDNRGDMINKLQSFPIPEVRINKK